LRAPQFYRKFWSAAIPDEPTDGRAALAAI
jgi:hypothetical protein